MLIEVALGEHLPGFFTPYAYVRYLTDDPLRMTGPRCVRRICGSPSGA